MTNIIRNKRIFTPSPFDLESDGGGVSLVTNDDKIKSLVAGTNIVITDNGDSVIIDTTAQDEILIVNNYSALPNPTTVSGQFYWVSNSQGTEWLPGRLGGTYYNKGLYYSNGVNWEYIETPYQATQAEVNTGTNNDKFVTPNTLKNSTQFQYLDATSSIQTQLNSTPKIILKSVTDVSHTGDTNVTQVYSDLITGATFSVGGILNLYSQFRKVGTAGNLAVRFYVNTSNSFVGATQIAQFNSGVAANLYYGVARMGLIKSATNTEIYNTTASIISSIVNSSTAVSSLNIDWTINQYFLISIQLTNATDTGTLSGLFLEKK